MTSAFRVCRNLKVLAYHLDTDLNRSGFGSSSAGPPLLQRSVTVGAFATRRVGFRLRACDFRFVVQQNADVLVTENLVHTLDQGPREKRLRDELRSGDDRRIDLLRPVARHEQHADLGVPDLQAHEEFWPGQARHHHIEQGEMNGPLALLAGVQGRRTIGRGNHIITVVRQCSRSDLKDAWARRRQ